VQYALLIYGAESDWEERSEPERRATLERYFQLNRDLRAQGKLLGGEELQPFGSATTVRVRDGDTIVGDGPFAETKEVLGGFYLVEADSLDEAIEWASRIPAAAHGTIEVRPVVDHSGNGA
jgi:hypothetical protein